MTAVTRPALSVLRIRKLNAGTIFPAVTLSRTHRLFRPLLPSTRNGRGRPPLSGRQSARTYGRCGRRNIPATFAAIGGGRWSRASPSRSAAMAAGGKAAVGERPSVTPALRCHARRARSRSVSAARTERNRRDKPAPAAGGPSRWCGALAAGIAAVRIVATRPCTGGRRKRRPARSPARPAAALSCRPEPTPGTARARAGKRRTGRARQPGDR